MSRKIPHLNPSNIHDSYACSSTSCNSVPYSSICGSLSPQQSCHGAGMWQGDSPQSRARLAMVAMAPTGRLVDLFRGMIESFKLLLTSQTFGSDYELLCTDLSVQLLRIRLWADSVGLATQDGIPSNLLSPLLDRQDFNETATQVIESISFLLYELQVIRDRYMLRILPPFDGHQRYTTPGSLTKLHDSFRLRSWANQKQKSIFAVAKWTIRDERRFDKKTKRLGALITGLEDIARAVSHPPGFPVQPIRPILLGQDDIPPPYSRITPRQSMPEWPLSQVTDTNNNSLQNVVAAPMRQLLLIMEAYLISFHPSNVHTGPTARDKLVELSDRQFTDLCVDVYDELLRRQEYGLPNIQPFQERRSFHPKRNLARRKLTTLVHVRFGHLIMDIVFELKRRYPHLQCICTPGTRSPSSSRSDGTCLHAAHDPPPLLQFRGPHQSTIIHGVDTTDFPSPTDHISTSQLPIAQYQEAQSTPTQDDGSTGILTSYRVKMDDPCSTVLPAVLLKYGITAAPNYSLYITYGDEERRLEMDDKPLRIFMTLEKEGKNPRFMLRKVTPPANTDD